MKTSLKISAVVLILAVFCFFTPSARAQAICPFPGCFGGIAVGEMFCDCSANFLVFFSPLYLYPSAGPITGALAFQPGTMKYLYYNILPSEGVIGSYVPGVQACWIYTGTNCVPFVNQGLILPDTGASLPGGGLI